MRIIVTQLLLSQMPEAACQGVHFIVAGIIIIGTATIRVKMRKTVGELCSYRKPLERIISSMTVLIFARLL